MDLKIIRQKLINLMCTHILSFDLNYKFKKFQIVVRYLEFEGSTEKSIKVSYGRKR